MAFCGIEQCGKFLCLARSNHLAIFLVYYTVRERGSLFCKVFVVCGNSDEKGLILTALAKIISGCKKKNPKYQRMLYDLLAGKMMFVCLRYLQEHEAQEALQDGFVAVFDKMDQYSEKGPFEAWARRIFVNTALQYLRKKKHGLFCADLESDAELAYFENLEYEEHVRDSSDIDRGKVDFAVVSQADLSTLEIIALIKSIKEEYSICFQLYFIDKYSHREIAQQLGIDESTSRSRLARAKRLLQIALYEESIKKIAI